jgi:apolipoprotein N-acyltransferase
MGNTNTKKLMQNKTKTMLGLQRFFIHFALLLSSALLFSLSHPNSIGQKGFFFLAYFMYLPLLILISRLRLKESFLYGFLYGVIAYCIFTYWLATFHPMGILVISFLYGFQYALLFPVLVSARIILERQKLTKIVFTKKLLYMQWLILSAYEFIKTLGFAGFHYGLAAYTQWSLPPIIQITDIVGVWGLSALILFVSSLSFSVYQVYKDRLMQRDKSNRAFFSPRVFRESIGVFFKPLVVWLCIFFLVLVYGFLVQKNYDDYPQKTIVLIQSNVDPWIGDHETYKHNLHTLIRLTNEALADLEKQGLEADLIVWPETAFIPRIEWHYAKRLYPESYEQVKTLLDFIDSLPAPILLGNDYGVEGYDRLGEFRVLDYNAALLFYPGVNVYPPKPKMYKKNHLVPFTEHFPFEKLFPKLYQALLNGDTHMWELGLEKNILRIDGLGFGTPICFEDTFGYIGRDFVKNGAQAFVNISNDAWSKSLACQYQHLSMAVFRSVENRVPQVRSTASGQTCFIDPNGRIMAMAEPFVETYLIGSIPIIDTVKPSLYNKWGDYMGYIFVILALSLYIINISLGFKKEKE